MLAAGAKQALKAERDVVHSLPVAFSLDGERGIRDPRGMIGDTLGVDMHVLTGDAAPQRNLELCINRSHLSVERMVATPYASGLAALVDDELEMGAACIDMGGGTTTISVFQDGKFVHGDAIPVGGVHVTLDLAKGLSTRFEHAERLKVMHGSALPGSADDRDLVTVQPMGGEDGDVPLQVPRSVMTRIIRARIEETLEIVRDRLNKSGYGNVVGKRVVLTGGASQLAGLPEAARRILGRNVRIGRPLGVAGLPEAAKGPGVLDGGRPAHLSAGGELRKRQHRGIVQVPHEGHGWADVSHGSVVQRQFLTIGGGDPIQRPPRRAAGKAKDEDMTINLKKPDITELKPRITVFGVGGGGGNAVNNMITAGLARRRLRRRQHRRAGADHVEGRAPHPARRACHRGPRRRIAA